MKRNIKNLFFLSVSLAALAISGCQKGTFDINSPNPNTPSTVAPSLILAAAITNSSSLMTAGNNDLINCIDGYFALSGDYAPNINQATFLLTTDLGAGIWNTSYPIIQNFKNIETAYGTAATGNNYVGICKIMKSVLFSRLVDCYNNIPYSQAANGGTNSFPAYDDAQTVYKSCVNQIDSGIALINSATGVADNPGTADPMFGGVMSQWVTYANTIKLKMLIKFNAVSGGPAYIASKMTGLTTASFISAGNDATVNPGYATDNNAHLNPIWLNYGYTNTGGTGSVNAYYRANAYAVNFYKSTNDPRLSLFYTPIASGTVVGRVYGATTLDHNSSISGIGGNASGATQTSGLLKSPTQPTIMMSAAESYFLQAEAVQRGYLTGATAASLYQSGVSESFRLLGVANYAAAAATYTAQQGDNVNFTSTSNPIKTIIIQKWAALNVYDPIESWSDWRRTGFPTDLPIPVYPGTTITHLPYRLLYPTSETNYNLANVNAQGTITQNSKIFWMP